jgi:hypothetical protein
VTTNCVGPGGFGGAITTYGLEAPAGFLMTVAGTPPIVAVNVAVDGLTEKVMTGPPSVEAHVGSTLPSEIAADADPLPIKKATVTHATMDARPIGRREDTRFMFSSLIRL